MNPLFIVALAPLGVLFLIGLVALFGGNQVASFTSPEDALSRFRKDFKQWSDDQVFLSDDGTIALLPAASSDQVGIVYAVGDCFATRIVTRADFDLPSDDAAPARVHIHDFSAPDITVPRALLAPLAAA